MSTPETSDVDALALVAHGDHDALRSLYDRYARFAFGTAMYVTRDAALAEDAVQETFLAVWRNAHSYDRRRGTARAWIRAIAHRRAVDILRQRRTTAPLPGPDSPVPNQLLLPDIWPEVVRRSSADEVRVAMLGLSPQKREAIELAYFGGLTHREIAQTTATPLGTIKSRIRLGLLTLRSALAPTRPESAVRARPAALLQRAVDARDLDGLLDMIRPDVIWMAAPGEEPRRVCTGREELRQHWRAFTKAGGNALPHVISERGATIVLEPRRYGVDVPAVFHVLRYRGAKIALIEDYPDQASALAACALQRSARRAVCRLPTGGPFSSARSMT